MDDLTRLLKMGWQLRIFESSPGEFTAHGVIHNVHTLPINDLGNAAPRITDQWAKTFTPLISITSYRRLSCGGCILIWPAGIGPQSRQVCI